VSGSAAAEPLDAQRMAARDLGRRFVARRRLRAWLAVLVGIGLLVGGFAGFGYYGGRADALVKHGTHTTARVTSAALYGGRYSRKSFNEHIDVAFATPGGEARGVRIYIGETDRFWVGEQVEVVYDPANPHRAELAQGRPDIGPIGFPLFFALVLGVCLSILGIRRVRLFHAAQRALRGGGQAMEASSELLGRRTRRPAVLLRGEDGTEGMLSSDTRRGWDPLLQPVEATVFGPATPGSVVVVVDPRRRAVTTGRIWKLPRLASATPQLARMPQPLVQGLLGLLVAAGLAAGVVSVIWIVRLAEGWQESNRIQAGPQVLGTIVSTGEVAADHQDVTLRYRDRTGTTHDLELRYPLGLATSVITGMTTTISYDPRAPRKAELSGHPRHRWQSVVLAGGAVIALSGLWLWIALGLRRALRDEPKRRRHLFAGVAGVVTLFVAFARILLVVVANSTPQEIAFPPNAPPLVVHQPATLPRVLSAPPPAAGPLVTPAQAHRIAEAVWPLRDRALADRDLGTLQALETNPALAVDVSRLRSGGAPNRPNPARTAPQLAVYVPRQRTWPIRFLAEAVTTSAGKPFLELLILARSSPKGRWEVVYDTGFGQGTGPALQVEPGIFDPQGYDLIPQPNAVTAADAVPHLARYWQAWRDDGATPAALPPFLPGTWTSVYGQSVAGRQDQPDLNGLPAHISYGDRPAPPSEVWTFGVYGNQELVCSPMHQTTTWTGPAHQDANRQKWGPDLAPGVYQTVTADILREPCILVPPPSGGLVAFGADRWVIHLTGTRG
jgi:Protein of unknown function (DUF3592)